MTIKARKGKNGSFAVVTLTDIARKVIAGMKDGTFAGNNGSLAEVQVTKIASRVIVGMKMGQLK